jgi:hypothetical protein
MADLAVFRRMRGVLGSTYNKRAWRRLEKRAEEATFRTVTPEGAPSAEMIAVLSDPHLNPDDMPRPGTPLGPER